MTQTTSLKNTQSLEVRDWGTIDYLQAFEEQKKCVQEVLASAPMKLILCEHPPVLTMGRLTLKENILMTPEQLGFKNIACYPIDRGGDVTLHAPGQLVVYAMLNLNYFGKDLKHYSRKLEQVAIDLLSDFDIVANRISGKTGVWAGPDKIVSLGIGVRRWVTFHGLGINVNTDLNLFSLIRPCGMDVKMTSMAKLKGAPVDLNSVKKHLVTSFCKNFELNLI